MNPEIGSSVELFKFAKETKDTPKTKEAPQDLMRASEMAERLFASSFEVYPSEHPAVKYCDTLLSKIKEKEDPETRVYLTSTWKEVNGLALPNGAIFISSELFRLCGSEEELCALLGHELQHIRGRHVERLNLTKQEIQALLQIILGREEDEKSEVGPGEAIDLLPEKVKQCFITSRLAEWESDLAPMMSLDRKGINPYGSISLLQKFADQERGKDSVLTEHGRAVDRLLNAHWISRLTDFKELGIALTPVPPDIVSSIGRAREGIIEILLSKDQKRVGKRLEICAKTDLYQIIATFGRIFSRVRKIKEKTKSQEASSRSELGVRLDDDARVLKRLFTRLTQGILGPQFPLLSKKEQILLAGLVLAGATRTNPKVDYEQEIARFGEDIFGAVESKKDIEGFLKVLHPSRFKKLSLCLDSERITKFCQSLISEILAKGIFSYRGKFSLDHYAQFCCQLRDGVGALLKERGLDL